MYRRLPQTPRIVRLPRQARLSMWWNARSCLVFDVLFNFLYIFFFCLFLLLFFSPFFITSPIWHHHHPSSIIACTSHVRPLQQCHFGIITHRSCIDMFATHVPNTPQAAWARARSIPYLRRRHHVPSQQRYAGPRWRQVSQQIPTQVLHHLQLGGPRLARPRHHALWQQPRRSGINRQSSIPLHTQRAPRVHGTLPLHHPWLP